MLDLTGLRDAARRRVGGYSMGMRQRLALAGALLGDPQVVILDEPANGLDREGIAWLRGFLRHLATEGRTVLVSSHVLSEVQQTVDDVLIIARGRLVRSGPLSTLGGVAGTEVRSPDPHCLRAALVSAGLAPSEAAKGRLLVQRADAARVGAIAHAAGVELHHLAPANTDLEQSFLRLVTETEGRLDDQRYPVGVREAAHHPHVVGTAAGSRGAGRAQRRTDRAVRRPVLRPGSPGRPTAGGAGGPHRRLRRGIPGWLPHDPRAGSDHRCRGPSSPHRDPDFPRHADPRAGRRRQDGRRRRGGLCYGVVTQLATILAAAPVLLPRDVGFGLGEEQVLRSLVLGVPGIALWAAVGTGLGILLRNQIAAVLVAVAYVFIGDILVSGLLSLANLDAAVSYTPNNASTAIVEGFTGFELLTWWAGALVLLGYGVLVALLGWLIGRRRDIS